MKALSVVFVFASAMLRVNGADLPKFDSNIGSHPPLSLGEALKQNTRPQTFGFTLPKFDDPASDGLLGPATRPAIARTMPAPPRFTPKTGPWKMPILEPNPNVDHKLVLKEPDPNMDPKMVIGVQGLDAKPAKTPGAP
jgi:hypothetical protein